MRNLIFLVSAYALTVALSQICLKTGMNQIGGVTVRSYRDFLPLAWQVISNPYTLSGTILLISSFFIWMYVLSWFKLGIAFPLTAMVYVMVGVLSYLFLGETFSALNYFGMLLIASGVFFLLYK